ncbi:MAG: hypothetical protein LUQ65_08785 [Candidatus Helarchaeota archaeon]|nr:hypothetical protein [Candidatus Helarchaeota archaeon]
MGKRAIAIAALLVIIASFLPWWWLFSEAIPSGADKTYGIFLSNPFFGNFFQMFYIFSENSSVLDLLTVHGSFVDLSITAPITLLIAVIISLIGGIIGLISLGKRKIAALGGLLVVLGVILYIVFVATGSMPGGVSLSYLNSEGLNPLLGTFNRSELGTQYNHFFGIAIGCILALIGGLALLFSGLKGKD